MKLPVIAPTVAPAVAPAVAAALAPAIAGCALALTLAGPALAQPIPIVNPGFEADAAAPGAFVVLQPTGWARYDPQGLVDQAANAVGVIHPLPGQSYFPAGAPEGSRAALVFLGGGRSGPAGLQQTLQATLQPDTLYTLSVAVGNIASGVSTPESTGGGGVFFNLDGFPGYRLELLAGGQVLAADDNGLGASLAEGTFATATLSFTSGAAPPQAGQPLGIRLINLDLPGTALAPAIEVDFDDVRLVASTVPEPAAWVLLLAGMAALKARRRQPPA